MVSDGGALVCLPYATSALLGWSTRIPVRLPWTHAHEQDTICRCASSDQGACVELLGVSYRTLVLASSSQNCI